MKPPIVSIVRVCLRRMTRACVLVLVTSTSVVAFAERGPRIEEGWIRLLPGDLPLGGYFTLVNDANSPVRLLGAESEAFERIMFHESIEKDGSASMRHVDAVEVEPGGTFRFSPGGYHLMLMNRQGEVREGDRIPITLLFEGGRRVTFEFTVRHPNAQ